MVTQSARTPLTCIVLAAGKGTRMKSDTPKVLHRLAGRAMLDHVLDLCGTLEAQRTVVVVGHGGEAVAHAAAAHPVAAETAVQEPQLGTAHAVGKAEPLVKGAVGDVLVLYADTPLITAQSIEDMRVQRAAGASVVVLGFRPDDPGAYGRLILDGEGRLDRIVEAKDASADELAVDLCNSGVMLVDGAKVWDLVDRVGNANAKGEFYLTDIVGIARAQGLSCAVVEADETEVLGVNSRVELAEAEGILQERLCRRAMEEGATMLDPASVHLSWDTQIGRDVVIGPNVVFGPGVVIEDHVEIRAFCHLEGARVASGATVGPFARLRPGAEIGVDAHIGNFVEIKKARIEEGAKVNHLSYIGDARVGARANIGAGTITCNYDGFTKSHTDIGAGAFIGSDTLLIAPVAIADGAYTGSGTVVTKDVPRDALAVSRPDLKIIDGWAARHRARKQQRKKAG